MATDAQTAQLSRTEEARTPAHAGSSRPSYLTREQEDAAIQRASALAQEKDDTKSKRLLIRESKNSKINDEVLFNSLVAGKNNIEAAKLAGSTAKTPSGLSGTVQRRINSSPRFAQLMKDARMRGLQMSQNMAEQLDARILAKGDVNKLSPDQAISHFFKGVNTIANLTKTDEVAPLPVVNIYSDKTTAELLAELAEIKQRKEARNDTIEGSVIKNDNS